MELIAAVVLVIILALFFDFTNGFHDTANAMATPIATGAIKPKTAVTLAACLNLVGAFLSTEVAMTISDGIIREGPDGVAMTPQLILAGLVGAITWNMLTWALGLPSSSSHALFGGLIGAAIVGAGLYAVDFQVLLSKVIIPALVAPFIAGVSAYLCTRIAYGISDRGEKANRRGPYKYGQILSSSLVALAHGTNDAQKTMGVITLVLVSGGFQESGTSPHIWVITACALAIALGTYIGGWRIIDTLGTKLTEVKPAQGLSAEASTAAAIMASSSLGFALSTTQVASGSVIGSGLGRKGADVKWSTAGKIASGWIITLPAAAVVGGIAAVIGSFGVIGVLADMAIAIVMSLWIFIHSQKKKAEEDELSNLDVVGEAVQIRGRKWKKQQAKLRKQEARARRAAEARSDRNGTAPGTGAVDEAPVAETTDTTGTEVSTSDVTASDASATETKEGDK